MGALPANSREKNSSQEQQQRSNANQTHRPNLNVLFSQPRLPIHSDDSEYFGDEDSKDNGQEEVVKQEIKLLQLWLFLNRELTNMMMCRVQKLQLEIYQTGQEIENLQRRMG
ncbi:hypothetical protein ES332_A06G045700v1 [Gossypium tomentosum]|uniref:Uncharacterized protein n=1 Tax=Gossypium tomentosum TaxID=34277 RepID=A0A5D2Q1W8_GOSTO|nr:hypothetical protein ES332_A06G045700v1 [Gossypium tomentosum]